VSLKQLTSLIILTIFYFITWIGLIFSIIYNGLFIAGIQAVIVVAEDASQFSQIIELSDRYVKLSFDWRLWVNVCPL